MAIYTLLYPCFTMFQVSTLTRRDEFAPFLKGYMFLMHCAVVTGNLPMYPLIKAMVSLLWACAGYECLPCIAQRG